MGIRPNCYKLYGYPQPHHQSWLKRKETTVKIKKVWKPKVEIISLIARTSLRVSSREDLYFNSRCSKHMTGEKSYLEKLKPYSIDYVTFVKG